MQEKLLPRICAGLCALTLCAGAGCDASEHDPSQALRVDLDRFGIDAVLAQDAERYTLVDDEGIAAGHVRLDRADAGLAAEVRLEDGVIARIGWSADDAWLQCDDGPIVDERSDLAIVADALDACGDELDIAMLVAAATQDEAPSLPEGQSAGQGADAEFRQCNWPAIGRQMDRYTALCTAWGYDQGIFTFNGCSVTLDYCIHW